MIVYRPPEAARRSGAIAGIAWPLWAGLVLSIAVLAGVRSYAQRVERRLAAPGDPMPTSTATSAIVTTPSGPVRAEDLRLAWRPVEGAVDYRLRVETITGNIVLDGLRVEGIEWMPPFDALPAFTRGEYRWSIEALDPSDQPICRSKPELFRIR
jgi:hypothetical protein